MQFEFRGEMWHWRGPAPHHFVSVPEREAAEIRELAPSVTYGWGMSPATVTIGGNHLADRALTEERRVYRAGDCEGAHR